MKNNKLAKWGYGLVASCSLLLGGCTLDDSDTMDASAQPAMYSEQTTQMESKPVQKSYASKDPTQKATPGPKRSAAPQIPVIQ